MKSRRLDRSSTVCEIDYSGLFLLFRCSRWKTISGESDSETAVVPSLSVVCQICTLGRVWGAGPAAAVRSVVSPAVFLAGAQYTDNDGTSRCGQLTAMLM